MPKIPNIMELLGRRSGTAASALPVPTTTPIGPEVSSQAVGPASGSPYRVTRKNERDLIKRINLNKLTRDDVATLRAIIQKEMADDKSLTQAESNAFRMLSSRILSERSLKGDIRGFPGEGSIETLFDDLYETRNAKYGGLTPNRNITTRDLLE